MRQVIKKSRTSSASEAADGEQQGLQPESAAKTPGVRLVHVEGRVQAIEVTCRCGDVQVLEIEYEQ